LTNLSHAIVVTGSIATGKSTVTSLLMMSGFKIIDADAIAHKLLDYHSAKIALMFGSEFVSRGKVERKKLGTIIFSDEVQRDRLEKFLHPLIKEEILSQSAFCESKDIPYIIDIPLFFEKKNYDLDEVLVVYTTKELQLDRLMKRENLSEEDAKAKISLQISIEDKKNMGSFVVDNSGNLKQLQQEVENFITYIKDKYANLKI